MPECVLSRNEGEPNLTEQVHRKLLKEYFNTGEAVDHSIMAPHQSCVSNKRMKLQGFRTSAKCKYKILAEFYYDAMQKEFSKNFIFALHHNRIQQEFYYDAMQKVSDKWL